MAPAKGATSGTIVDRRKRIPFVMVERLVLRTNKLSNNAKLLYQFLVDYAGEAGSCFPGQQRLTEDLRVGSVDTIQRALGELRQRRLVDWQRSGRNRPNVYSLLPVEDSELWEERAVGERAAVRSDTAPMRSPDTAPMRHPYEQDPEEQESAKQHHSRSMERRGMTDAVEEECDDVVVSLMQKGVTARVARALVSQYAPDRIIEKLELTTYLVGTNSPLVGRNPAGWLRRAIEEDFQPPAEYGRLKAAKLRHQEKMEHEAQAAAAELRSQAGIVARPVGERARERLRAWERGRRHLGKPALSGTGRAAKLRELEEQFAQEAEAFFTEHPELRAEIDAEDVGKRAAHGSQKAGKSALMRGRAQFAAGAPAG